MIHGSHGPRRSEWGWECCEVSLLGIMILVTSDRISQFFLVPREFLQGAHCIVTLVPRHKYVVVIIACDDVGTYPVIA